MKQKENFVFKYQGDLDYIDINTLIVSQIHFTNIIEEIKNEVCPENDLSIKVRVKEKGSFPIELQLLLDPFGLFSSDTVHYVADIMNIWVALIILREFLKGKKPTKTEVKNEITIIYQDNKMIEVNTEIYKIYSKNTTIDQAFTKGFESLEKDEEITGITLTDKNDKELFNVPRNNFSDIIAPNEIFEEETKVDLVEKATLRVFKVVFGEGYKWQFYYLGNKVSANINDEAFMGRVGVGGEGFVSGDVLVVDLQITQVFDQRVNAFINKSFSIEKVHQHIKRDTQGKFDL
jgi:hypothetical protein